MSSDDTKRKHSKRIKQKRRAKVRSVIAQDLLTSGLYRQRIVKDKHGRKHDMDDIKSHYDLVKRLQEIEDYGNE